MKQKIAILSLCFTGLMYLMITVSLAGMIAAFPEAGADKVKLVVSLPSLTGILGIWAVPMLAGTMGEKRLCTLALALLSGAGLAGLFVHKSLMAVLVASALIGFAYGVITTMYPVLIMGCCRAHEQAMMMGLGAGMLQIGRLITSLVAGVLAKNNWHKVFFGYLFALAALIVFVALMPKDGPRPKEKPLRDTSSVTNPAVWKLAVFGCLFACFYFVISTDGSVYIESAGLGQSRLTGLLSSLSCAVSGIVAVCFFRIYRRTGNFTLAVAFFTIAGGYLTAGLWVSRWAILTAFLLGAVGISLFTPWLMMAICPAAGKANAPVATALILTVVNVGYTVSPYVTGFLGRAAGEAGAGPFLAAGVAAMVLGIVSSVCFRKKSA